MHKIGLYHPQIHFPSDAWVKAAALYWTQMARIVPGDYTTHDSDVVLALRDQLDFVVDIVPPEDYFYDGDAFIEFAAFVRRHSYALRLRYSLEPPNHDLNTVPYTGSVHYSKVDPALGDVLTKANLAHRRGQWYEMHSALARVYMSALAGDISRRNRLCPVTDDRDMYAVGPGWTEERMRNVLLPDGLRIARMWRYRGEPTAIGMLAIQAVVPRDIDHIPVGKIIQLRQQFKPQFVAFRDAMDAAATEIGEQLRTVEDPAVLRAYINQEIQERFVVPLQQLRRELRRVRLDTATATLTFKYEVPTLATLAAGGVLTHHPLIGGGTAAAIGLMGLKRGMRAHVADQLDKSQVGYLMLLQDNLDSRSALHRMAKLMRRIVGSR